MILLNILIYTLLLYGIQELIRRFQVIGWSSLLFIPPILIPWWRSHYGPVGWFEWAKISSVWLGVFWGMACRFSRIGQKKWALFLLYIILLVNITEALIKGLNYGIPGYLLGISALLINITLPGLNSITINTKSPYRDLSWNISQLWIIGYTIWNIGFVYVYLPESVGIHTAVLGAAFIAGLINHKLWVQARVFTLGAHLVISALFAPFLAKTMGTPEIVHPTIALFIGFVSLVWMTAYSVLKLYKYMEKRKPQY